MSKASQQTPDLHEIFDLDGEPDGDAERVISVERRGGEDGEMSLELAPEGAGFERVPDVEIDPDVELEAPEEAPIEAELEVAADEPWSGITRPSQRGSSQRFLTDVIVDMGLATRKQVEDALENSRISGVTPERVLIEAGAPTPDALRRGLPGRSGLDPRAPAVFKAYMAEWVEPVALDHLDLGVFQVDMAAANLVS